MRYAAKLNGKDEGRTMRISKTTILLIILIAACFSIVIYWRYKSSSLKQEPESSHRIEITTKIIDDGRLTMVSLQPMLIDHPDSTNTPLELTADFTYGIKNNKTIVLPAVTLDFTSESGKNRFLQNPKMVILLDSESIKITGQDSSELKLSRYENESMEWIQLLMSPDTFKRIAQSKKVEYQLDSSSFRLDEYQMMGLRALAGCMSIEDAA